MVTTGRTLYDLCGGHADSGDVLDNFGLVSRNKLWSVYILEDLTAMQKCCGSLKVTCHTAKS